MCAVFNPDVGSFRFHVFSVRPCYEFLSPEALTPQAAALMSPEAYYSSDAAVGGLKLERLGRRSRDYKEVGAHLFQPHRFWSVYLSKVAHTEYRGPWFGFAPYRVHLESRLLRLTQDFRADALQRYPGLKRVTVFPKAYVTPLGWISAVSVELAGRFPFDAALSAALRLRTESAYSVLGAAGCDLRSVLIALHRILRKTMVAEAKPGPADFDIHEYMVASPVVFEEQLFFNGRSEIDVGAVLRVLHPNGEVEEAGRLITPTQRFIAVSAFNHGSILVVRGKQMTGNEDDEDLQPASCALSNFKNALMITAMMQRYHQLATNRPAAQDMRAQVAKTFAHLKDMWESRHFQAVVENHTGLTKMLA